MPDDLYHRDFVAWSAAQAERLRRLQAGERVTDLDWENVIEEIETSGRSEVRSVRSLLRQALLHAMEAAAWPEDPSRRHWRNEIRTVLADAREGFTPSMRQLLDLAVIHGDALRDLRDLEMDRPPLPLRETTDLTLDELLSRDLSTDALIARLRAD